ncbi:two-component regulator propeller domain-containing protein, partial [Flavobacterium sp.]|uniref:two-component regulator propeller domain-containing protein n=1 Tax=Flavobacterium sp. TaxID=239 RepID=UPI000EBBE38D
MNKAILLFCLLIYSVLNAQIQYKFSHFTTDDGLPTNSIYAITEDKNGNLVLGTDNGLTFFNGNDFKTLNVKDGLINPYVVAVFTDQKGVVWFINYNGKLQKFENNRVSSTSIFTNQTNAFLNTKEQLYLYTMQNRYSNKTYYYNCINKYNWNLEKPQENIFESSRIAPPILAQDDEEIKLEANFLIYKNKKVAVPKDVSFVHKVIFRKNDV